MQLELEKQEFLYSLKPKDKEVVRKAIALYYDYLDYNEAMSVKKSIDNGKSRVYSYNEFKKALNDLKDKQWF